MIILEGPDGSGKSTLARQLARTLNIPIAGKVVGSDTKPLVNLRQWVDDNLDGGFQRVIFDRHRLISEPIYGTVMPDRDVDEEFWDPQWFHDSMARFNILIKPIVVYCMPPFAVVQANVQHDLENISVRREIRQIYNAYLTRMSLDSRALKYDYTTQDADLQFDSLVESIIMRASMRVELSDRQQHSMGLRSQA